MGRSTASSFTLEKGKDKTTVRGRFGVLNKKNVTLKNFTVTKPNGNGLRVEGEEALVEMLGMHFKECGQHGLYVRRGATVKATRCEFNENGWNGVFVFDGGKGSFTDCTIHHNGLDGVQTHGMGTLVKLRGDQTVIHNNKRAGLSAWATAPINIYIPSRPITAVVHDNKGGLLTYDGGKIQLQHSSSSSELTIIQEAPEAVYDY